MTLAAMLCMAFTCRANLSDCTNLSILNLFIRKQLKEIPLHAPGLECKVETDGCKRKEGLGAGPPSKRAEL